MPADMSHVPLSTLGNLSNMAVPTPEQALRAAHAQIQIAQSEDEVHECIRALALALGARRTEAGTIKALRAVLNQLIRPGMSDKEAWSATGASKSNYMKWRKCVHDILLRDVDEMLVDPEPFSACVDAVQQQQQGQQKQLQQQEQAAMYQAHAPAPAPHQPYGAAGYHYEHYSPFVTPQWPQQVCRTAMRILFLATSATPPLKTTHRPCAYAPPRPRSFRLPG